MQVWGAGKRSRVRKATYTQTHMERGKDTRGIRGADNPPPHTHTRKRGKGRDRQGEKETRGEGVR